MALHSKIRGKAHIEDSRPSQKFFGGEYAKTKEGTLVFVEYSIWSTTWNAPRWDVHVTTNAPLCGSDLYKNGSIFDQTHLELANE